MDDRLAKAAAHWSNVAPPASRTSWWLQPAIVRHVNHVICGEPIDGPSAGFRKLIMARMPDGGFPRAVSVGSGVGAKEIALLTDNIVQRFDLFEISEERLRASKRLARRNGVFDRISFHGSNAFEADFAEGFDLVHWNDSLHHMFDVHEAVAWSHRNLKPGGLFAMNDFIGPSHFQWTDLQLDIAAKVRGLLPERLMRDPANPLALLDRAITRPDLAQFIAVDPSEAADSSNILGAVTATFPQAEIRLTGGLIYHLALEGVMANFDLEGDDAALMRSLLLLDETLASSGHSLLAVAFATKEGAGGVGPLARIRKAFGI